jgi:hypothetical protein
MDQSVEIPYAVIQSMGDLAPTQVTEGSDGKGNPVMIQRYVAKSDGRIYDCAFRVDVPPLCFRRDDLVANGQPHG